MKTTSLNIHGLAIRVTTLDTAIHQWLNHDFSYFLSQPAPSQPDTLLSIVIAPSSQRSPNWRPLWKIGRCQFYFSPRHEQRLCFFREAWVQYLFQKGRCQIYCDEPTVAYEVCQMVIQSWIGEKQDLSGVHRIHGMAVAAPNEPIAFVMLAPSGGGKSTLAFDLLEKSQFHLLSDDTPFISPQGTVLAYPERIALKEPPSIPPRWWRRYTRVKYGDKYVINTAYFKKKIRSNAQLQKLILLTLKPSLPPKLKSGKRRHLVWPLIKWLVVGHETPQIWELYLRPSKQDILRKMHILASRCRMAYTLYRKCEFKELQLSSNRRANLSKIESLLIQEGDSTA